jgi:uncharacterized integral membrane protein (TIGR00698 family)
MTRRRYTQILPGVLLASFVAAIAFGLEWVEVGLFGRPWFEALVIAILLGTLIHTVFGLDERLRPGIDFSARTLLEIAIVLLGASIGAGAIGSAGAYLIVAIAGIVVVGLAASYVIGRGLGLSHKLATLVACGNSICGNSAIVAVSPVIEAESDDVAASIAFTAALGIIVVLLLPVAHFWLDMTQRQFGVLAGLTVYAVPQVIAATAPVGLLSTQIGTLVKLVRVLMLGPVILLIGLTEGRRKSGSLNLGRLVPWFIIGFLLMMGARSLNLIPAAALGPISDLSGLLTLISMAALGLMVDMRTIASAGGRVLLAGVLSLAILMAASFALLAMLEIP